MNTDPKSTASQLRLVADLIDTKHPWEFQTAPSQWLPGAGIEPQYCVSHGLEIRPVLATPLDGRPLHNPDNLTAEQVGVGYRLALEGEQPHKDAERWEKDEAVWESRGSYTGKHYGSVDTYRLPLSVPWPEPADPYAELKAAHEAGKVIQYRNANSSGVWSQWHDYDGGVGSAAPMKIDDNSGYRQWRIKPEPALQLPPPPPGMKWHENTWKADMLPKGFRPLYRGETICDGDEYYAWDRGPWKTIENQPHRIGQVVVANDAKMRTTRPLIFTHAGKQWTYHKPGDPMPCDGERKVEVVFRNHETSPSAYLGSSWSWKPQDVEDDIIGWRYAEPATKLVELGPEDVPPGSVVKHKDQKIWSAIVSIKTDGFHTRAQFYRWSDARYGLLINRPRHRDSSGNPTLWFPCSKTIPQNG